MDNAYFKVANDFFTDECNDLRDLYNEYIIEDDYEFALINRTDGKDDTVRLEELGNLVALIVKDFLENARKRVVEETNE